MKVFCWAFGLVVGCMFAWVSTGMAWATGYEPQSGAMVASALAFAAFLGVLLRGEDKS